MPESNVEIVRTGLDAWNERDVAAVIRLLDDDAELVPMRAVFEGTVYRGKDGFRAFFADISEEWEDFRIDADEVRDIGDSCVLVLGRLRGRGKATGTEFEAPAAWACELRAGKVVRVQFYADEEAAREDLGTLD